MFYLEQNARIVPMDVKMINELLFTFKREFGMCHSCCCTFCLLSNLFVMWSVYVFQQLAFFHTIPSMHAGLGTLFCLHCHFAKVGQIKR